MPQPRSRKEVVGLERWEVREERKERSLLSASESSNQIVPSSAGLEALLVSSVA